MNRARTLAIALGLLSIATVARAQSAAWKDRVYITIGGDVRLVAANFSDVVHPIAFAEAAVVNTAYQLKVAPGFEVGGGVRVWRNLALGVDSTRANRSATGSVDAQVPHPFVFGQPRAVAGNVSALGREETAVHVLALWMIPLKRRWQVAVAGGPSWLQVRQDVVQDVIISQAYPYDSANYVSVVTQRTTRSHVGFNAGADATYLFKRHVGLGISATFSRARVPLGASAATVAGGLHAGGGLRLRF